MKKNIIYLSGALLALTACSEQSWNDHLDGYEKDQPTTIVKKVSYTLTNADYSTIAGLASNIAIAEDANALAAIKKSLCFNDVITPELYIPAFLGSSKYENYLLDNGSIVNVTYNIAEEQPEELTQLLSAEAYTVTKDDYMDAWGSDEDYIAAFAPSVKPSKYIPFYLNAEGLGSAYAMVTYKYAEQEPIFQTVGGGSEEAKPVSYIIVADGVAATAIAEDKTYGYIGGTEIDVNNIPYDNQSLVFTFVPATGNSYYMQDCNGRYYYKAYSSKGYWYNNFNVSAEAPEESATVSALWQLQAEADGSIKLCNETSGQYLQLDTQYRNYGSYDTEKGITPKFYQVGAAKSASRGAVVEVPTTTMYGLYKSNDGKWSEDTSVAVLQPADYAQMGASSNYIDASDANKYITIYMNSKYPYASKGNEKYVVYFTSSKGAIGAKQCVHNGTEWEVNDFVKQSTTAFVKKDNVWSASAGLAVFTHVKATELVSGATYVIATDEYAAKCLNKTYSYGYLQTNTVEYDPTHLNITDNLADCEFVLTLTENGWTIQDQYERYYYQVEKYNSFNVATEITSPDVNGFYWDITITENGTTIVNKLLDRTIKLDPNYGSYGSYASLDVALPVLFIAASE